MIQGRWDAVSKRAVWELAGPDSGPGGGSPWDEAG